VGIPQNHLLPLSSLNSIHNPLVVAVPRSGFSLLIGIVMKLLERQKDGAVTLQERRNDLCRIGDFLGQDITRAYYKALTRHVAPSDIIYNGEFHCLPGGVKWIEASRPEVVRVRKYVGIRGQGDFLHILNFPRIALETYEVLHSHHQPSFWLEQSHFSACPKLTSIRNPAGILNSSCFSFNAMASEYIQKFLPGSDETFLRQQNALYKLTDVRFFRGLIRFLKKYLEDYLPHRGRYFEMRWEDLIQKPIQTIMRVGEFLGIPVTEKLAGDIWGPMDHVNTLKFHQHNFRKGKGIVGDWKNSLVREHLDIMQEEGLAAAFEALGYPFSLTINPDDYSNMQKIVASHLQRREVFSNTGDPDLFGFAFNKSNIDVKEFPFLSYPPGRYSEVERSTVANEALVLNVRDEVDRAVESCESILHEFECVFRAQDYDRKKAAALIARAEAKVK